ncbi:hypothetical protein SAMN04488062_10342 [Flavobacterium omnivorum]|uniref:Uncharacterized protein n=1 Tax=Flavobacterium omnivorum TaxID=178355 RepID=A0A1G7Y2A1_9FLAO|nr:hypothetical protein [Flavobacterium omnivorum]SDG90632.1 hypothetical protein SAMN04488062_10342 [Flavobacterium omnivorum]
MKEDIFSIYPILKLITGMFCCLVGVVICLKNKFYKLDTDDMIFTAKLKIFLSGLLFIMTGMFGFVSYFFDLF